MGNKTTTIFKELTNKYSSISSDGEISKSKYRAGEADTVLYAGNISDMTGELYYVYLFVVVPVGYIPPWRYEKVSVINKSVL